MTSMIFAALFIVSANANALNCRSSCEPGARTQAGYEQVCRIHSGNSYVMSDGRTYSQMSCEAANPVFGCEWKQTVEVVKCSGGQTPHDQQVCAQQNVLPDNIQQIACQNLSALIGCKFGVTCE